MAELLVQLLTVFGPLVLKLVQQWQADHNTTALPTIEQLTDDYQSTIDAYLAEGAAYKASHP